MAQLSEHFTSEEFKCKDGCGYARPRADLIHKLEVLRKALGKAIPIVSGCRCCPHNSEVGGALRSRHVYGEAADLPAYLRVTKRQAEAAGFTGIGLSAKGVVVHVDVRQGPRQIWTYST